MRGWLSAAGFFAGNVLLLATMALSIVIIDRWLMDQRFFVGELITSALFLLVSTAIFLLFLQAPVQWLLRNSSSALALSIGLAVLSRRLTMYVTLSLIGAIFSVNFQRRVRYERFVSTSNAQEHL